VRGDDAQGGRGDWSGSARKRGANKKKPASNTRHILRNASTKRISVKNGTKKPRKRLAKRSAGVGEWTMVFGYHLAKKKIRGGSFFCSSPQENSQLPAETSQ